MGKKGGRTPFIRGKDVMAIYNEEGDFVGEYNVNYSKEPKKAMEEMDRFMKDMEGVEGFNTQSQIAMAPVTDNPGAADNF